MNVQFWMLVMCCRWVLLGEKSGTISVLKRLFLPVRAQNRKISSRRQWLLWQCPHPWQLPGIGLVLSNLRYTWQQNVGFPLARCCWISSFGFQYDYIPKSSRNKWNLFSTICAFSSSLLGEYRKVDISSRTSKIVIQNNWNSVGSTVDFSEFGVNPLA